MHAPLDHAAFEELPGPVDRGILILCDHASNHIPAQYSALGLSPYDLGRHIAYDIGVDGVTRRLAQRLGAPALLGRFSRLLVDPNRGLDDPTLIMRLSEGTLVPGNARLSEADVGQRIANFYLPYDQAIARWLDAMSASGTPPMVFSIHSFTPVYKGVRRPWDVGILWDRDDRLARPLLDGLGVDPTLVVGDNEPYSGALEGDTLWRHATRRGLSNALVEIRHDLISDDEGIEAWANRLTELLEPIVGSA